MVLTALTVTAVTGVMIRTGAGVGVVVTITIRSGTTDVGAGLAFTVTGCTFTGPVRAVEAATVITSAATQSSAIQDLIASLSFRVSKTMHLPSAFLPW